MEDVGIKMILTGLVVLVTNMVSLRYLMKDIKRNTVDIRSLFKMSGNYMSREEIGEQFTKGLARLEKDSHDTNKLVHDMKDKLTRMDERMKGGGLGKNRRAED